MVNLSIYYSRDSKCFGLWDHEVAVAGSSQCLNRVKFHSIKESRKYVAILDRTYKKIFRLQRAQPERFFHCE